MLFKRLTPLMWHWGLLHFLVTTALTYLQSKLSDSFLLRLVAVSGGASGASTTGPGARTIGSPGTPLSMHRLQVQLLVHTHTMSAILHVNKQITKTYEETLLKTIVATLLNIWRQSWILWSSAAKLVHKQLGGVVFFAFLIFCLDLIYIERK